MKFFWLITIAVVALAQMVLGEERDTFVILN